MTNLLHTYIAEQLAERINRRHIVVWYDPRREFDQFVAELEGDQLSAGVRRSDIGGTHTVIAEHDGSLYSLRCRVEPFVSADAPEPVLVYLSGVSRDPEGSVLMELETAGARWEPQLRQLARVALRQRYTDGVIDELLARDNLDYGELVAAAAGDSDAPPSVLKMLLAGSTSETKLAAWLANDGLDVTISEKEARPELRKLIASRLEFDVPGDALDKWRATTARFILAVEFRSDLRGDLPPELDSLPRVSADVERNARTIASALRDHHATAYPTLADQAARELQLGESSVDPLELGAIDSFRFEERALLRRCAELVRDGEYRRVVDIAEERAKSYWLRESLERQAQWEALRLVAELGAAADDISTPLAKPPKGVDGWVEQYAEGWYAVDRAQRHLEAWLPKLDDDPDERALAAVRGKYDSVLGALATGFVAALAAANWSMDNQLQQTGIYDDVVRSTPGRVAYFLVDAMRYEMGAELVERLSTHGEVTIRPAVGVLPSITTTGMGALMPGASSSYDVVDVGGKLVALVEGTELADLRARKKYLAARVPSSVDLELGEVHTLSRTRLRAKLGDAELVVIRSQEIDFFGESRFQARAVMDTVIENLARAVRKLAAVGIGNAVITADHGHIYASADRDESMRIDAPGGHTVELHRRCWIGRGGATPPACVRVAARALGNDTDLDLVFPVGAGVFRAGGDLAFHHGGPSPQEMIIPVITVRSHVLGDTATANSLPLSVGDVPAAITNRIFSVKLALASLLGGDTPVMPVLMSEGRQVGTVGMAIGAEHDRTSGTLVLAAGVDATIGFVLDDDEATEVRIVVLDPGTDAELYRSPSPIPVRLGVT
jgi:hypothetical protein